MKRCAAVLLLLAGCAAAYIPVPTIEVAGNGKDLMILNTGRRLYIDKCSGCHSLYSVDALSDKEWRDSVQEMIRLKKVVLDSEMRSSLETYLTTMNGRD